MKKINFMKTTFFYFMLLFTFVSYGQTVNYDVVKRGDSTYLISTTIENANKNVNETYIPDVTLLQNNLQQKVDSIFMQECIVVQELKRTRENLQNVPTLVTILNKLNANDYIKNQSDNLLAQMSGNILLYDSTFAVIDTLTVLNSTITSTKYGNINSLLYYYNNNSNLGKLSLVYNEQPLTFYMLNFVNQNEIWADLNSSYYLVKAR